MITIRKTYWHKHPRNFANECDAYTANTRDQREHLEDLGYEQLSREDMRRHLRWVNAENAAWGSNRASGDMALARIDEVRLEDVYT